MRKSFILSLVMVVVLIASLATATFAWYTTQDKVETNTVTATTAAAGDSLVISAKRIKDVTYTNQSVTLTLDALGNFNPMTIKAADNDAVKALNYTTFKTISTTIKSDNTAAGSGDEITPATLTAVTGADSVANTNGYIFIANPGAGTPDYKIKVTLSDGAAKGLRVAVFRTRLAVASDSEDTLVPTAADLALVGIWCPSGETVKCATAIAEGNAFSSGKFAAETAMAIGAGNKIYASESEVTIDDLPAKCTSNDVYAIRVYFEGDKVTNAQQGATATFAIEFNKVNA